MDLGELQRRLYDARRGGARLELDRVCRLLDRLGSPQGQLAVLHVGGTNGKGSTAAFASSLLAASGRRVGLFTSPHLSRLGERFRIDGVDLDDEQLLACGAAVEEAVAVIGGDPPTFFERITGMALVAFAGAGVEVAVLEVGLGGRFDATNAVDGVAAAVTGVAMDHADYLGDSLAEIAREKAGIFRPGRPAVIGCAGEASAVELLVDQAHRIGVVGPVVVGDAERRAIADLPLGLAGAMQRANAACALALVEAGGYSVEPAARLRGLANARMPGRFEAIAPNVIVDGAHNPHAARALADELADCGQPIELVVGWSAGKDAAGIAGALAPLCRAAIATRSRSDRAEEPEQVAGALVAARPDLAVTTAPAVEVALERARARVGRDGGLVVVCGSLFVVAEAREAVGLATSDRVELRDPV